MWNHDVCNNILKHGPSADASLEWMEYPPNNCAWFHICAMIISRFHCPFIHGIKHNSLFLEPSFTMRVSLITNRESDGKLASRTNSQSMCENWDYLFHLYLNLWLSQPFQRAGSRIHPITHLGPRHSRRAMLQLWHFFSPQNVSNRRGVKFNRNQKRVNG